MVMIIRVTLDILWEMMAMKGTMLNMKMIIKVAITKVITPINIGMVIITTVIIIEHLILIILDLYFPSISINNCGVITNIVSYHTSFIIVTDILIIIEITLLSLSVP